MKRIYRHCFALCALLMLPALVTASQLLVADNPLVGSWKSDKYLTRQSIINEHRLSAEQKSLIMKNGDFGEAVLTFSESELQRAEDEARPYTVQSVQGSTIVLELAGEEEGQTRRLYIRLDGDTIYVPSSVSSFYEVYTRQDN